MPAKLQRNAQIHVCLFLHVEPFQRQDRSSCVVRREESFTLEELKRAGGKLKVKYSAGDRRGTKLDPQRGDRGIPEDPPGSFQLLSS